MINDIIKNERYVFGQIILSKINEKMLNIELFCRFVR